MVCEKRARVHGGSKSKGANSEEAAEKGRNEINQIATLLENAIWLPKRNPLHNRKERIGERIWRRRQRFGFGCDGLMAAYSPRRPRACAAPAPGWRFAQPDAGSRVRRQPPLSERETFRFRLRRLDGCVLSAPAARLCSPGAWLALRAA